MLIVFFHTYKTPNELSNFIVTSDISICAPTGSNLQISKGELCSSSSIAWNSSLQHFCSWLGMEPSQPWLILTKCHVITNFMYSLALKSKFFLSVTGGLFDDVEHPSTESAFRYSIFRVNSDHTLLSDTRIAYDIQHLPSQNSFLASKKGKRDMVLLTDLFWCNLFTSLRKSYMFISELKLSQLQMLVMKEMRD